MQNSSLGIALFAVSVVFVLVGILDSSISWTVAALALMSTLVYSRLRFISEIESTNVDVHRSVLDESAFTGEGVGIKLEILNKDPIAVRGLFEDIIPPEFELLAGNNRTETELPSRSLLTINYTIAPKKRGQHVIGGVRIRREDVFGLLNHEQLLERRTVINAHTRKESIDTARRMAGKEHLEFSGMARNPSVILRELEFDGIREYVPGDRARDIHWKLLPKLNKLMTKVYKKEGALQTMVFVDCGRSMRLEDYSLPKIDHAVDLSIQISSVLLSSFHPAGVATFDEVKVLEKAPPALGRHQFERILKILRNAPGSVRTTEMHNPATATSQGRERSPTSVSVPTGQNKDEFLMKIDRLTGPGRSVSLGIGLEGAIKETLAKRKGQELLFIVISDLISSRDAILTGARICQRRGSRMLVIHTYNDWYKRYEGAPDMPELEHLYADIEESLKMEGMLRGLGASYLRVGPADTATGIVRAIRRGKA